MSRAVEDCGCAPESIWPPPAEASIAHDIAWRYLMGLHAGYPGHEECCDLPVAREAIARYGVEAVAQAVTFVPERKREYAREIVEMAERD